MELKIYSPTEDGFIQKIEWNFEELKTEIAEKLVPAYKNGERETLKEIANTLLPQLKEKTKAVHEAHKRNWHANYKTLGWGNLDVRYAGVAARCDTAIEQITGYLNGETESLEALEEERLYKGLNGFITYSSIASPNLKT